jgi:Holliday junction resolvase-like predicted endonuclease
VAAEVVGVRAKEAVGHYGEDVAARQLLDAGLEILARKWR